MSSNALFTLPVSRAWFHCFNVVRISSMTLSSTASATATFVFEVVVEQRTRHTDFACDVGNGVILRSLFQTHLARGLHDGVAPGIAAGGGRFSRRGYRSWVPPDHNRY